MMTKVQSYFLEYPEMSRLWVFMAERTLKKDEVQVVKDSLSAFIPEWKAHGDALKADFEIIDNQFIVIAVDETPAAASGCSIDSMTRYIQDLEKKLNLSFTNRMLVAYKNGEEMRTEKLATFKEKVKNGDIAESAIVYNNGVANLLDFRSQWQRPLKDSWAASLLP